MKKKTLFLSFVVLMVGFVSAQAQSTKNSGSGFAYQAVLRDVNGSVLDKKEVKLTFSLCANETSAAQWSQTKNLSTDQFGVVKTIVGKGDDDKTTAEGFSQIDFGKAQYWFKVELQLGEEAAREISFAQLPSMPYAESAFSVSFTMPVGSIIPFAGPVNKIPDGWMPCDGTPYRIDEYPALYDVIGDYWPKRHATGGFEATAEGYFRVPDLRGIFLRGLDSREASNPIAYDHDRTLGSYQDYAVDIRKLKGNVTTLSSIGMANYGGNTTGSGVLAGSSQIQYGHSYENNGSGVTGNNQDLRIHSINFDPAGLGNIPEFSTETRPVNRAVNYIIKY